MEGAAADHSCLARYWDRTESAAVEAESAAVEGWAGSNRAYTVVVGHGNM